jgi:hypothetical protein
MALRIRLLGAMRRFLEAVTGSSIVWRRVGAGRTIPMHWMQKTSAIGGEDLFLLKSWYVIPVADVFNSIN